MYSPIALSVVLKRQNQTTLELLGKVFIRIAARSRLSSQMADPCKERILVKSVCNFVVVVKLEIVKQISEHYKGCTH